MKYEDLKFLDDMLRDVDHNLIVFYRDVIAQYLQPVDKKIVQKLRRKYVKKLKKDNPCSIDFGSPAVRSAYVFYYCPCFTSAMTCGFVQFLREVPDFVEKIFRQDTLTVCSFGGGPASEIVAISSVIREVLTNGLSKRTKPLTIDAVVVEADPGWKETADGVVRKLQEQSAMLQFNFRFLEHDLVSTQLMSEELKEVLGRSDIVTMVKLLSAIHGQSDRDVRSRIIQGICDSMQDEGTLFLMESSGWKFLKEVEETLDSSKNMSSTYGPFKQTHRMSKASKDACLKLYFEKCGIKYCAFRSINKVSAWCKKQSSAAIDEGDGLNGSLQ